MSAKIPLTPRARACIGTGKREKNYPPCTGKRYQITPFPNNTKLSNRITTAATRWHRGKLRGAQSNQACWLFLTGGRGRTMTEGAVHRARLCEASFVSMASCRVCRQTCKAHPELVSAGREMLDYKIEEKKVSPRSDRKGQGGFKYGRRNSTLSGSCPLSTVTHQI
ncbi:hypothetical protein BDV19DRAFT_373473 [Aspergillus venezuelensis]